MALTSRRAERALAFIDRDAERPRSGNADALAPGESYQALLIVKDDLALDEHLLRARERGVVVDEVEPTDPGDLRRGWKVHRPT